jgi:hypothetical protein
MRAKVQPGVGSDPTAVEAAISTRGVSALCLRHRSYCKTFLLVEQVSPQPNSLGGWVILALRKELNMCDYSLEHLTSRQAAVADKLIATQFPSTITRGFADAGDPTIAVCLRPGTEIAFDKPARYVSGLFRWRKTAGTVARFRQIDVDVPATHHDALEFPDGTLVLVTRLVSGQHATVLQLPNPQNLENAGRLTQELQQAEAALQASPG